MRWGTLVVAILFYCQHSFSTEYMAVAGGYNPFRSEASLEKNMETFQSLVDPGDTAFYYFGAGPDSSNCDVVEMDPTLRTHHDVIFDIFEIPVSNRIRYQCKMRPNKIKNLSGPATKKEMMTKLYDLAQNRDPLGEQSPFRFYFSGHGGDGSTNRYNEPNNLSGYRQNFNSNTLATWDSQRITVQEFTKALDAFPKQTPIQTLMVQCYSGGFAQINYQGGILDLAKIADANRCGFFSQEYSQVATGCTPDVFENIDYSHFFFKAYQNKNQADYNQDGKVGSTEAHAYATIHAPSIDRPTSTSEALLEDFYELNDGIQIEPYYKISWKTIEQSLNASEKAILLSLSKKLGIDFTSPRSPEPKTLVMDGMEELSKNISRWEDKLSQLSDDYQVELEDFRRTVQSKFPWAFLNPALLENKSKRAKSKQEYKLAQEYIPSDQRFSGLKALKNSYNITTHKVEELKIRHTYFGRMNLVLNKKILEAIIHDDRNYKHIKNKYEALVRCEQEPYFIE